MENAILLIACIEMGIKITWTGWSWCWRCWGSSGAGSPPRAPPSAPRCWTGAAGTGAPRYSQHIGINLLCAAKEYDQIYWVMYSGQSFKFKGLCVVVHPINWVMYSNPALKIIGLFVVVHPINWDTSHTIQYIRIHHRQSNILGYIRGNPLFADNPIHWNALENDPILCDTLDTIQ